jgi:hypothetical protein
MSTQVAVFNPAASLPSYAKGREISALTKSLAGGGAQSGKRISVKGGVFRLISDGKQVASIEERYLDVVVVAAAPKISRTYYAEKYSEDNPAPPTCWSADGATPDATAANKQSPQCATCPQNEKGSGNGESRACAFNQRIAVVLANDVDGDILQLQLAATSIFGKEEGGQYPLQAYARWLAAQNVEANEVITRMKFDTANAAFPKLFFKAMRWLSEDEHDSAVTQGKSPDAQRAVTMTVAQTDKVADPLPPKPKADEEAPPPPPKSKKAAAEPAADDEPPAPEPTKRKAAVKEAPEVPSKGKLADVLSKWDDE